jgi:uncharacterized protein
MKLKLKLVRLFEILLSTFKILLNIIFILLIRLYQLVISPLKPPSCRYTPTCSEYAIQAFKKFGAFKGLLLSVSRILRCHPWGGHGYDPIP